MNTDATNRAARTGRKAPASSKIYLRLLLYPTVLGCNLASEAPSAEQVWKLSGPTMGTAYHVSVVAPENPAALRTAIDQRLAQLNRWMSTYDPESELSRFNRSETTDWFEASPETVSVVAYALEVAEDSRGAFDPTIGPLVNLWGFGPDPARFQPPDDDAITAARRHVGYTKVETRSNLPALKKSDPHVYVDLSAVAKGYGVDRIGELLEEKGFGNYLVEIGGEVRARGVKPGGAPWRVGVEKADAGNRGELQQVVELADSALATSGDYRNFFEHEGVRYSHTIHPATGRPVMHDLATVTVLAPTCREADALATALLVLGNKAGYDWAASRNIAAFFVSRREAGEFIERATPQWNLRVSALDAP